MHEQRIRRGMSLLALALTLPLSACGYNTIQEMDEDVEMARGNVEAELMRRNDLIPNLVATVDEAAAFEQETFTRVAEARSGLAESTERMAEAVQGDVPMDDLSAASAAVAENLRLFLNVSVEAYPTLTANQSFVALQDELTETENRIAFARRTYNETVRDYNAYIRKFPVLITAKIIGADPHETFAAPESAQQAPQVEFN